MNILILGALPKTDDERELYGRIANCCFRHGNTVSSPLETSAFDGSNDERFKIAIRKVEIADLLVGEQSKPSTGQGFELGYAYATRKPFVILTRDIHVVSGLIKGCPNLREILSYSTLNDLEVKLDDFLSDYRS